METTPGPLPDQAPKVPSQVNGVFDGVPEKVRRAGWFAAVAAIMAGGMYAGLEVEKKRWGCVFMALVVMIVAAAVVVAKLWW